jgi:hypothetical protein
VIHWKIYYDDDTTYSGPPELAPALGVQVIVVIDKENGWHTVCDKDYYAWDDRGDGERWWAVDFPGLIDYFIQPGYKIVLLGREIPTNRYQEIFNRAMRDRDFPPKTGYRANERKP